MSKFCPLLLWLAATATLAADRQSLDDAWWTGPMLAPTAATLPQGRALVEPYLIDIIGRRSAEYGSLTYLYYGVTDQFTVGAMPFAGLAVPKAGKTGAGIGDLTVQAQYRLSRFDQESGVPALSAVLRETFPTGRHDRLGDDPAAGMGGGAYATSVGLFAQTYVWLANGRIVRLRLDLLETLPQSADVTDVSVYGTAAGFRGKAQPGRSFSADGALEYSITRQWVAALDLVYGYDGATRLTGMVGARPADAILGDARPLTLAPALEYNWRDDIGLLVGVRVIAQGRDVAGSLTPAVALNMVF